MREITREMIKEYRLMKLGYDFMGYDITNKSNLSFHHLIIPHRNCKAMGLGEGYLEWNGAILNQNTSHDYLHLIEAKDYDMFLAITSELIDENDYWILNRNLDEFINERFIKRIPNQI